MPDHDHHDWHSETYVAEWIQRYAKEDPHRLHRFRLMASLIPFPKDEAIVILDVGAGYAPLTKVMLEEFPKARIVAQDYSEPMLSHARKSLKRYGDRVTFVTSDLMSPTWAVNTGGPFHAIVTSLAIHNLRSPDRTRQLYREVMSLVRYGGCFLNVDLINAPSPELQRTYWTTMMALRGQSQDTPSTTEAEVEAPQRRSDDPPFAASVEEQVLWLRDAGFQSVDCFWKELGEALVGGFKR